MTEDDIARATLKDLSVWLNTPGKITDTALRDYAMRRLAAGEQAATAPKPAVQAPVKKPSLVDAALARDREQKAYTTEIKRRKQYEAARPNTYVDWPELQKPKELDDIGLFLNTIGSVGAGIGMARDAIKAQFAKAKAKGTNYVNTYAPPTVDEPVAQDTVEDVPTPMTLEQQAALYNKFAADPDNMELQVQVRAMLDGLSADQRTQLIKHINAPSRAAKGGTD